jgi:pyridoxine/pyridoxamine 5'-phosphate oxidase
MTDADLDALRREVWQLLSEAVRSGKAPFHTPVLASADAAGAPRARTVVLREADAAHRRLRFHTDARSHKVAELTGDPRVELVFYDRERRVQVRAGGAATVHRGDDVARAAWEEATLWARRCYLASPGPGSPAGAPTSGLPAELEERAPAAMESEAGLAHFAVVRVEVTQLDRLDLHHTGHRRASWRWDGEGWRGTWLIP